MLKASKILNIRCLYDFLLAVSAVAIPRSETDSTDHGSLPQDTRYRDRKMCA